MSAPNEPHELNDDWITYEQAAVRIGASRGAIQTLARRGLIDLVKLSPRIVRVSVSSLERYINLKRAEQHVAAASELREGR